MKNDLTEILDRIVEDHKENIDDDSRYYLEVSIAQKAAELDLSEAEERYQNAYALVPLKAPLEGMKVRIDGRTFVHYAQFESGIVVPNYVAGQVDLSYKAYAAKDSMICIFT